MKSPTTLISLAALVALASCVKPGDDPPPGSCAGWRPVQMSEASLDYLATHDPETVEAVTSHMEFGDARGCW